LAANAIPPARIDIVKPRDNEAIDDNPDDVSILWKNAVNDKIQTKRICNLLNIMFIIHLIQSLAARCLNVLLLLLLFLYANNNNKLI